MDDWRQTYLCLCKEAAVEPQESILSQLKENKCAHRLDLSGQSLSTETCSVLAKALQTDTVFTEVSFSDCMLSEEGAAVLLTGLFGNTTVKVLDLKGNNLRSKGAEVLGKLLAHNKALHRLVLEWNALGLWDEAFSLFCDGLTSNSMLTQLDLRNNQINHHGATELALVLKRNSSLEVLDLRWNSVGLLGGRALLGAMQKNTSLLHLEIAGNNVPGDILRALEQTTAHNSDRKSTLRETHSRSQVLSKEIHKLKEEKRWQFLSLMETIDRQREEMGQSNRSTSIQISQLQEALNERKSAVNSLTAKLQMTEAALALSEQKNHNMGELLTQTKTEKEELMKQQSRERKKEQEDSTLRERKLLQEIQNLTATNIQLRNKVEEIVLRCKSQQQQIFALKQELTNNTAELKLRLAQTEEHLEQEKHRSKQTVDNMDSLRQMEQEHVSSLEEKLSMVCSSLQEAQLQCYQQKQTISELQVKNSRQNVEMDSLRRRIEELQQELSGKEQEKLAEVSRVKVELQEQIGHLNAERTAQGGLKEKISALEREIKGLHSNHRGVLLDKESEMASMLEKLRLKETEIQRMRESEAQRASYLQSAVLAYVQGSTLGHHSTNK